MEEEVGERLAARHLARAVDATVEQVPQAGEAQREAHLLRRARARDTGVEASPLQRQDGRLHAGHRLQRALAKGLVGRGLQGLAEIVGHLAAELGFANLDA
jgi:hypothetical protein